MTEKMKEKVWGFFQYTLFRNIEIILSAHLENSRA